MKIWIDILTPKQVNLFSAVIEKLKQSNFRVISTSRRYRELDVLLKMKGVKTKPLGKHGGYLSREKLLASLRRAAELTEFIRSEDPDLALSFCSPEAARVSFGLSIPQLCLGDSPHATAVCRLTIPLCQRLISPSIIPRSQWVQFGISSEKIRTYKGLDPVAWLRSYNYDLKILSKLGLKPGEPIFTVRLLEEHASYMDGQMETASRLSIRLINELLEVDGNLQIVAIPRYYQQISRLTREFKNRVIVPNEPIDATSLIRQSSVFIGGGGTMTAEAALLGVPAISYSPSAPTLVESYLQRNGLVRRIRDPKSAVRFAFSLLDYDKRREVRRRAARLMKRMESPVGTVVTEVKAMLDHV